MNEDPEERTAAMTDLVRSVLKMSAHAERAGSALNRGAGLTNARWLMIDQAAENAEPMTVSEHARRMGLSRQAVQRLTDDMVTDGWVELAANPRDRRARVVVLTEQGRAAAIEALERSLRYNALVSEGFSTMELRAGVELVQAVTTSMAHNFTQAAAIGGPSD